jgi:SAM-dependent methyltransferase
MDKQIFCFLNDNDLSQTQIYVTTQTFDRFASDYASKWEWNPKTISEVQKYNIKPFSKHVKKGASVLVIGCQSGRDYKLLTESGYRCLGVGFSCGLLTEAIKRVPDGFFVCLKLQNLPFMPESFDAIYADAPTTVPRAKIKGLFKDFRIFLRDKGKLYLSLKLGKKNILQMNDLGGKRYLTMYRKSEILKMLDCVGFEILWSEESPHTHPNLPKWFSLVAQKI